LHHKISNHFKENEAKDGRGCMIMATGTSLGKKYMVLQSVDYLKAKVLSMYQKDVQNNVHLYLHF
jgi:hypothetical protein